jgi:hypothetical protein
MKLIVQLILRYNSASTLPSSTADAMLRGRITPLSI